MADPFWQAEPGWVLLRSKDGGLLPFNARTRMAEVIEDEEENARVVQEMISSGIPLVGELPPA